MGHVHVLVATSYQTFGAITNQLKQRAKAKKLANVMALANNYVSQVNFLAFYQNLNSDAVPDKGETDITDDEEDD